MSHGGVTQGGVPAGREPGMPPGDQPGMSSGDQPGMSQGDQPDMSPGNEPGMSSGDQPGMAQDGQSSRAQRGEPDVSSGGQRNGTPGGEPDGAFRRRPIQGGSGQGGQQLNVPQRGGPDQTETFAAVQDDAGQGNGGRREAGQREAGPVSGAGPAAPQDRPTQGVSPGQRGHVQGTPVRREAAQRQPGPGPGRGGAVVGEPAPAAPEQQSWARQRTADRTVALTARLEALSHLITVADGRIDVPALDTGRSLISRSDERLQLSTAHSVAALVGATGSGKSSLFNAITGLDISPSSVRRPTTSRPHACVWGQDPAEELLDWLGVANRNKVRRSSLLPSADSPELDGFVLLDLPDHDSTNVTHRLEVDRMVDLADLLVWVLDPQKYADAAIHQRYLRHLADHQRSTIVLLNQIDVLSEADAVACLNDVRRLLAEDGLTDVPVLGVSAKTGAGLDVLKARFTATVSAHAAAVERIAAGLDGTSDSLAIAIGGELPPALVNAGGDGPTINALGDDLAKAAGVPTVADTVEGAYALRARQMTGWTWARLVRGMLPERESRLPKSVRDAPITPRSVRTGGSHARLDDERSAVGRAAVDGGLRAFADRTAALLPPVWADPIDRASRSRADHVPGALDGVLATTDLGLGRRPGWWRLVWTVQWILAVLALVGGIWQVFQALVPYVPVLGFVHQTQQALPVPDLVGLLAGSIVLVVCLVLGIVLALVTRPLVRSGARRAGRYADQSLRDGVWQVMGEHVLTPVRDELAAYAEIRSTYQIVRSRG